MVRKDTQAHQDRKDHKAATVQEGQEANVVNQGSVACPVHQAVTDAQGKTVDMDKTAVATYALLHENLWKCANAAARNDQEAFKSPWLFF